ncbi:MAG: hypothetical protein JTT11_01640 [Candidatus Brockarchaeota archaeon]|nr:hypothetical protein [Candidatus Brockarchaeota archaeon]
MQRIVLTKGKKTIGIGGGQMSRVDSAKIAIAKAGSNTQGVAWHQTGTYPL